MFHLVPAESLRPWSSESKKCKTGRAAVFSNVVAECELKNKLLNLASVGVYFYSAADSFDGRRGPVVQSWLNGYCAVSAMVDSLAQRDWAPGSKREKLRVSETQPCLFTLSTRSWLRPGVCTLRRRRQSSHAAETAGAAHPSAQQHTQQLANARRAAQDLAPPGVLQRGVCIPSDSTKLCSSLMNILLHRKQCHYFFFT